MTDDVLERLARYVANHPGVDVMEVLANADADPALYRDVVEQLLGSDSTDIHELKKILSANASDYDRWSGIGGSTRSQGPCHPSPADPDGAQHPGTGAPSFEEVNESGDTVGLVHHDSRARVWNRWAEADFAIANTPGLGRRTTRARAVDGSRREEAIRTLGRSRRSR